MDMLNVDVASRREGGKFAMFAMVHDPHPKETFLDVGGKAGFGWCMFFV